MKATKETADYIKNQLKAPYVESNKLGETAYQICVSLDAEETWERKGGIGYINSRSSTFIIGYANGNWVYDTVRNFHTNKFDKKPFVTIDDAIAEIQKWIDSHAVAA